MHLHFERTGSTVRSDCTLLSLTWMGKVPDESPTDISIEGNLTLNRGNYYKEGWLASGNTRGMVGVTFTTAHTDQAPEDIPLRTNYNLRGHRSEVTQVRWNEPYQKLASCDSTGVVFVWIKFEGRWSIELINDRNTQVTDFAWSHNGRMVVICYSDGFVLVGSVAGQRYWSSMLNLESTITCGIWTPDDQYVYFGTTNGEIIVMDIHGAMVAQVIILADVSITGMVWSCEKFRMDDRDEDLSTSPSVPTSAQYVEIPEDKTKPPTLPQFLQHKQKNETFHQEKAKIMATAFKNGSIYLMKSYDDVSPIIVRTDLKGLMLEWNTGGDLLAVAGYTVDSKPGSYKNMLKFYTDTGYLRYSVIIPNTQFAVSAMTWGHNDKRLFLATGNTIHIGWIYTEIASLRSLSCLAVSKCLNDEQKVSSLPIPLRLKSDVQKLFFNTIGCYLPEPQKMREFATKPPPRGLRLYCTMIRHEDLEFPLTSTSIGSCYTLYLEFLGGLIPILKGKRNSKIRPEFIIFDPQNHDSTWNCDQFAADFHSLKILMAGVSEGFAIAGISDDSDSDIEDSCTASPRLHRKRRMRRKMIMREQLLGQEQMKLNDDLAYFDFLPEHEKLVEVTSNIWGTRFKIHGVSKHLPANLGSVTYKTSLLHLQPRQMTLRISEIKDGFNFDADTDPSFNPNSFSEDEDEIPSEESLTNDITKSPERRNSVPIAPMTPNKQQLSLGTTRHSCRPSLCHNGNIHSSDGFHPFLPEDRQNLLPPALDGTDDEYVNFFPTSEFLNSISNHQNSRSVPKEVTLPKTSSCNDRASHHRRNLNQSIHENVTKQTVPSIHCQDNSAVTNGQFYEASMTSHPVDSVFNLSSAYSTSGTKLKNGTCQSDGSSNQVISVRPKLSYDKVEKRELPQRSPKKNSKFIVEKKGQKRSGEILLPVPNFQWATRTGDLKYIDDDIFDDHSAETSRKTHLSSPTLFPQKYRSHSIGHLDDLNVVSVVPSIDGEFHRVNSLRETKKRLMLSQSLCQPKANVSRPKLIKCGKSKSLDSGSVFDVNLASENISMSKSPIKSPTTQLKTQLLSVDFTCKGEKNLVRNSWDACNGNASSSGTTSNSSEEESNTSYPSNKTVHFDKANSPPMLVKSMLSENKVLNNKNSSVVHQSCDSSLKQFESPQMCNDYDFENFELTENAMESNHSNSKVPQSTSDSEAFGGAKSKVSNGNGSPKLSRALSPSCMRRAIVGASYTILNSPLLNRRRRGNKSETSDEEGNISSEDIITRDFKDLGSLQKAQIKQKLRKGPKKISSENQSNGNPNKKRRRQFKMHNKAPLWNDTSQVYQLDFGGRVTQESAKNFQIEFKGKQVMQFGRIDGNAYTLDFQYPFTAVQAFAVALANVTQRLK
ncbi:Tubby-related protein 4 [Nymphon striatum]|nr:Tubby-related protein 4 [Nymphon striatum]